ncbi:hypothetical protein [Photobacterium leiognathi]|uniref:hypothetical protein n=1 Tax=Photobacterium leiognathi TaxID=553611 RepID=UPI002738843B|nr:hypothetical protein [Photobacterium leiognathi]
MSIKTLLTTATAICSLTSVNVFANDSSWWRDADDYYRGLADSTDSTFQAVVRPAGQQTDSPFVGLRLVTSHKEYCSDKDESFSDDLTMAVNDRKVTFKTSCYKNEWLNIRPASAKANNYLLEQFNYHRNKNVRFVMTKSNGPDWVFNFPTKGFGKLYSSIKESVKKPIE